MAGLLTHKLKELKERGKLPYRKALTVNRFDAGKHIAEAVIMP